MGLRSITSNTRLLRSNRAAQEEAEVVVKKKLTLKAITINPAARLQAISKAKVAKQAKAKKLL